MILLLTLSNLLFIVLTILLGILYLKLRKRNSICIDGFDKDIERVERILNSIIIRMKSK